MTIKFATLLLAGTILGIIPDSAHADAASTPEQASAGSAGLGAADAGQIGDIVVTAQRRSQPMQQVPIAIVALSADQLNRRGLNQSSELVAAVPGLEFNPSGGNGATPFIRGVGATNLSPGFESPVAIYLDDAYVGAPPAGFFSLGSVSSVEVLKGPQGTLFGRNATAGVIQVRTRNPSQQASGELQGSYGSYDTASGSLYLNTPLTSNLAVNFAADGYDQGKGYGRNLTTGRDIHKQSYYSLRGKILWQPSGGTNVLLTASHNFAEGDTGLNTATLPGTVSVGGGVDVGRYNSTGGAPSDRSRDKEAAVTLKIDQDLGPVTLTSISAMRNIRYFYSVDQDGSAPFIVNGTVNANTDIRSQELHLASSTEGNLTWLAGLYYFYSRAAVEPAVVEGSSQAPFASTVIRDSQALNSYSGFADATFKTDSGLSLTLGGRYTKDDYDLRVVRYRLMANGSVTDLPNLAATSSSSKFTYRGILAYHVDSDATLYVSRSRGFKSGGYNLYAPTGTPVAPEVLDATEGGAKTEWFGRRLRVNVSAFNYDYANLQITQVIVGGTATLNAGKAHIWGGELDFEAVPIRNFNISGGVSLQRGHYTDFKSGPFYVPNPQLCPPAAPVSTPPTGGNRTCSADLTGQNTVQTPPLTLNLAATYTVPTAAGDFGLNLSYYYNDGFFWDAANQLKSSSYSLVSASLNWTSSDGRWSASVWGKNLGDVYYQSFAALTSARSQAGAAAPRTFGATLGAHF